MKKKLSKKEKDFKPENISPGDTVGLHLLDIGIWNYYFGFVTYCTYRGKFKYSGKEFHLFDPFTAWEEVKENRGKGYSITNKNRIRVEHSDFGKTWEISEVHTLS